MTLQRDIFLKNEGNNYLSRNKEVYTNEVELEGNELFKACDNYLKPGFKVLEIGCCNGKNLNRYTQLLELDAYGIDPSNEAIELGKKQYPQLTLKVGTSDLLEFEDAYFDMVIFGCCLCLVDRKLLMKSISEADRVLKNKGILSIIDFDVNFAKKNPYKHVDGLFTYKYDYSKLLSCYPEYSVIEKTSKRDDSKPFFEEMDNRVANWILLKDYEQSYL